MKLDKKDLLLYAVTDRHWLNGRTLYEVVKESLDGGATFIQLREKNLDQEHFLEEAKELKKGIICFSPLAQGLLTDRYLDDIPADSRIRTDGRFLKESTVIEKRDAVRSLNEIAAERGQKLSEMALSWILKDNCITSVLVGASRPGQILDNIKALENTTFTKDELDKIDSVCNG